MMSTDPEIAKHLDLSTRSVRELRSKGVLPPAGSDLEANRLACLRDLRAKPERRGRRADPGEFEQQRTRYMSENADRTALLNAQMRNELVPIAPIRDAMISMIEVVKRHLLKLPKRLFPSDPVQRKRMADGIEMALIDLSAERAIMIDDGDQQKEQHHGS